MDKDQLAAVYREYISCLNRQDWTNLGRFVSDDVQRNGERHFACTIRHRFFCGRLHKRHFGGRTS
jgi:predicted ester cyclase